MSRYNPAKECFLRILERNMIINGVTIPILTEYPPLDNTDCITMVDQTGVDKKQTTVSDELSPLDEHHPYYDENNPDIPYAQKTVYSRLLNNVLELHIWSNSSDTREEIVERIYTVIGEATSFNYKYCSKLNTANVCSTTTKECDALTVLNHLGVQGKCPYADENDTESLNYRNPVTFFEEEGISVFAVFLRGEQNVDDLTKVPEVYHSVIPIEYEIERKTEVNTNPVCAVELTDTDITRPAIDPERINRLSKRSLNEE
jgi:hypothetical protein